MLAGLAAGLTCLVNAILVVDAKSNITRGQNLTSAVIDGTRIVVGVSP